MAKGDNIQFAAEIEAAPGTAETLVVDDVPVRLGADSNPQPEYDLIELNEATGVDSKAPDLIGAGRVTFPVNYVLRGPGDLVTVPAIDDLLRGCLFSSAAAKTIAIGAITTGPYVVGELITGSPSGGTGRVLQQTATGAASIPYLPVTGALASGDTITGGTSGATSTSSAGPIDGGRAYRPVRIPDLSVSGNHLTCRFLRDGRQWTGRGCLGDMTLAFEAGGPCRISHNFVGALHSEGDAALFDMATASGGGYPERSVVVPKFLTAALKIDGFAPTGIREVTISWPTNPQAIADANSSAADGIRQADYERARPEITLTIDQNSAATKDWAATLKAGLAIPFELTHGAAGAAGTRWTFASNGAQLRPPIAPNVREPNAAAETLTLGLTGDSDDDMFIWQH